MSPVLAQPKSLLAKCLTNCFLYDLGLVSDNGSYGGQGIGSTDLAQSLDSRGALLLPTIFET
jgi:hypothetical protein